MRLTVRQITSKPEWIAKVSAFLHDATIITPPTYEPTRQAVGLTLSRVGYEFAVKEGTGFLVNWRMPVVPAILAVGPVSSESLHLPVAPDGEPLQLQEITLPTPAEVRLTTTQGSVSLRCQETTTLQLEDTGPPSSELCVTDVGVLIVKPDVIADIVNATQV